MTLGCVLFISIVQFSRINPLFQRSKIILSNLHFVVKHFFEVFYFLFFSALPISHQRKLLYQIRFCLSMFFFQNIRCKSFRYFVFRAFSSGTVNYYTRFSKNVNTFFNFFSSLFSFSLFFLMYIKKTGRFQPVPLSSIIMLSSLLQ